MTSTIYLYSLARREHGSDRWVDVVRGVNRRQFVARVAQDGIERKAAERWAEQATLSVFAPTVDYAVGDRFDYTETGPGRESYRVVALAVQAPSAALAQVSA